ncbi:hypothetical protein [Spirosoma flavum]|uniref:Uncharacterized protein n=1 Tax=Spirosoma flavum TaxID=2048557 RepID=A0ABW6AC19_9BACT
MTRHANDLKQQIERILRWEQPAHWRFRDFELLSQLVFTHTNRRVDAHDLQAFWESSAIPPPFCLDTLACFIDYAGWADFCTRNSYGVVDADDEIVKLHAPIREIPTRWVVIICWLSLIASILVGVLLVWKR